MSCSIFFFSVLFCYSTWVKQSQTPERHMLVWSCLLQMLHYCTVVPINLYSKGSDYDSVFLFTFIPSCKICILKKKKLIIIMSLSELTAGSFVLQERGRGTWSGSLRSPATVPVPTHCPERKEQRASSLMPGAKPCICRVYLLDVGGDKPPSSRIHTLFTAFPHSQSHKNNI